ncbi:MAG TPA: 3-phosphoserine/phosphohydroxythreonine transaminase [Victivallales bacterium]|nr:3-phosphoserine/phosphohydroxythreonine transaminase [Victivallales bacterium]
MKTKMEQKKMRVFNFSAGPSMLPTAVMEKAQKEFCDYSNTGCGIMELSHRGAEFTAVIEKAEKNIREIMRIPDDYSVCFIQGGASLQFAMIPMNFLKTGSFAEYADTGSWSSAAIKQSQFFGETRIVCSSKETKYDRIPPFNTWKTSSDAAYLHITSNNTIYGTQYKTFPQTNVPLLADMSSDIMSRQIDVSKFSLIYAGAQKNLGPAGVAVVIIKNDFAAKAIEKVPTMLKYSTYIEKKSLYNTPPTFAIYMIGLVTDWIKENGGLSEIEKINEKKAKLIYDKLDSSKFYKTPVQKDSRSNMNVVFTLPNEELETKFLKEAKNRKLIGLKGHRSVGGMRASIYNAMPLEGVEKLVELMDDFEKTNA